MSPSFYALHEPHKKHVLPLERVFYGRTSPTLTPRRVASAVWVGDCGWLAPQAGIRLGHGVTCNLSNPHTHPLECAYGTRNARETRLCGRYTKAQSDPVEPIPFTPPKEASLRVEVMVPLSNPISSLSWWRLFHGQWSATMWNDVGTTR